MSDIQIGERIRELRELRNFTREGLAEKIGVSAKFLYEVETGKKGFSAEVLRRMSQTLAVSCDYIMFGMERAYPWQENVPGDFGKLEPAQMERIRDILRLLYEMCGTEEKE